MSGSTVTPISKDTSSDCRSLLAHRDTGPDRGRSARTHQGPHSNAGGLGCSITGSTIYDRRRRRWTRSARMVRTSKARRSRPSPSRAANRSGSGSATICARQPRGQQPRRFVRRPSVEWHERASGSGDPHDVGSPAVWRHRPNLDEIRPSPDGFFEAMEDVGHQSRCGITLQLRASFSPVTRRVTSEATHEGTTIVEHQRERVLRRRSPCPPG